MTTDTRTKTAPRQGSDFSEFKRGWRVVLLGLFGICTSITAALLYAFGTLVIPLEQAFGWSRGDLQASITFLFAGVAGIIYAVALRRRIRPQETGRAGLR